MIRVTHGSGDFIINGKAVARIRKVLVAKTKVKMRKERYAEHIPEWVDCYFTYKGKKCVLRVDNPLYVSGRNGGWEMIPGRYYTFYIGHSNGPYVAFIKLRQVLKHDTRRNMDKEYVYQ